MIKKSFSSICIRFSVNIYQEIFNLVLFTFFILSIFHTQSITEKFLSSACGIYQTKLSAIPSIFGGVDSQKRIPERLIFRLKVFL
jgi:hypothetical protein